MATWMSLRSFPLLPLLPLLLLLCLGVVTTEPLYEGNLGDTLVLCGVLDEEGGFAYYVRFGADEKSDQLVYEVVRVAEEEPYSVDGGTLNLPALNMMTFLENKHKAVHCAIDPTWPPHGALFVGHIQSSQIQKVDLMPAEGRRDPTPTREGSEMLELPNTDCASFLECVYSLVTDTFFHILFIAHGDADGTVHYLRAKSEFPWGDFDYIASSNTYATELSTSFAEPLSSGVVFAAPYDPFMSARDARGATLEHIIGVPFGMLLQNQATFHSSDGYTILWRAGTANGEHALVLETPYDETTPHIVRFNLTDMRNVEEDHHQVTLSVPTEYSHGEPWASASNPRTGKSYIAVRQYSDPPTTGQTLIFELDTQSSASLISPSWVLPKDPSTILVNKASGHVYVTTQNLPPLETGAPHVEVQPTLTVLEMGGGDSDPCWSGLGGCGVHGTCVRPHTCECHRGYVGTTCDQETEFIPSTNAFLALDEREEDLGRDNKIRAEREVDDESVCCSLVNEDTHMLYLLTRTWHIIVIDVEHAMEKIEDGALSSEGHHLEPLDPTTRVFCDLDKDLEFLYIAVRGWSRIIRVPLYFFDGLSELALNPEESSQDYRIDTFAVNHATRSAYAVLTEPEPSGDPLLERIDLSRWDIVNKLGSPLATPIEGAAVSPDGSRLFVGSFKHTGGAMLRWFDTTTGIVEDAGSPVWILPDTTTPFVPPVVTDTLNSEGDVWFVGGDSGLFFINITNVVSFAEESNTLQRIEIDPQGVEDMTIRAVAADSAYPYLYVVGTSTTTQSQLFVPSLLAEIKMDDFSANRQSGYVFSAKYTHSEFRTVALERKQARRRAYFVSSPSLGVVMAPRTERQVQLSTIHKFDLPPFVCENDCNEHGECVGPNTCTCEMGYDPPLCLEHPSPTPSPSVSPTTSPSPSITPSTSHTPVPPSPSPSPSPGPCSSKTNCRDCLLQSECGWCSDPEGCREGNADGPFTHLCSSAEWYYDRCPSVGARGMGITGNVVAGMSIGGTVGGQILVASMSLHGVNAGTSGGTSGLFGLFAGAGIVAGGAWTLLDMCQDIAMAGMLGAKHHPDYLSFSGSFGWASLFYGAGIDDLRNDDDDDELTRSGGRHLLSLKQYGRTLGIGLENLFLVALVVLAVFFVAITLFYWMVTLFVCVFSSPEKYPPRRSAVKDTFFMALLRLAMIATFGVAVAASLHITLTEETSSTHSEFRVFLYIVAWIILFSLMGFIGIIFMVLWRHRAHLDEGTLRRRFQPLLMKYNGPNFWFSLVHLLLKFFKGVSMGFFRNVAVTQCSILLVLQFGYLGLILFRRPFVNLVYDRLEILISFTNVIVISIALKIAASSGEKSDAWAMIILQFLVLLFIVLVQLVALRQLFVNGITYLYCKLTGRTKKVEEVTVGGEDRHPEQAPSQIEMRDLGPVSLAAGSRDDLLRETVA